VNVSVDPSPKFQTSFVQVKLDGMFGLNVVGVPAAVATPDVIGVTDSVCFVGGGVVVGWYVSTTTPAIITTITTTTAIHFQAELFFGGEGACSELCGCVI
jgi:hypothetical protein